MQSCVNFNTAFDYLLMLTYFSCAKSSYHSQLMFMWFSVTETYWWSARTSCSFVIYWCWHIFCVENILRFQYWFWLFTDVDYFSCAKCFGCFGCFGCTSSSFVIYCFWLFTDVDYFSCENVFIILDWCLCDFLLLLLLKHINEVDGLHPHLSLTYFLCVKCSTISILLLTIY